MFKFNKTFVELFFNFFYCYLSYTTRHAEKREA